MVERLSASQTQPLLAPPAHHVPSASSLSLSQAGSSPCRLTERNLVSKIFCSVFVINLLAAVHFIWLKTLKINFSFMINILQELFEFLVPDRMEKYNKFPSFSLFYPGRCWLVTDRILKSGLPRTAPYSPGHLRILPPLLPLPGEAQYSINNRK